MIPVQELRIGNWVETYMVLSSGSWYDNEGNRHGEEKITEPTIRQKQIDLEDLQIIHKTGGLATYRGIPLTPECLIACGFKNDYTNHFELDNTVADLNFTLQNGLLIPDTYYTGQAVDVHIKSLHQLQNLIFALTGKELEYNPK